jgi:hypothetical protein
MTSQFYEGGATGSAELYPPNNAGRQEARRKQVRDGMADRDRGVAERFRQKLVEWYGPERAAKVSYAEAFEICEYGRRPDKAEIRRLFPFYE